MRFKTGLEVLRDRRYRPIAGKRIALLANPASVDRRLKHAADILLEASKTFSFKVAGLFGPQQGFFEVQEANMVEWEGSRENPWGVPLYSLYGKARKPTEDMLNNTDCFVVDLQDAGAKGYTFISTLYLLMEACQEKGLEVLILDRPNPLGNKIEGPVTEDDLRSFVGIYSLAARHGLTIAEIANLFAKEIFTNLDLKIVRMGGYSKSRLFPFYGRPWIPTSPNLPFFSTLLVYPGMELLEGTNLSEGRGTTRPFEQFGAPFVNPFDLARELNSKGIPGAAFRPVSFTPSFDKYMGQTCYGAFIHVTNENTFSPVECSLEILETLIGSYGNKVSFKEPPYEYEHEKMPFDIIAGTLSLRLELLKGTRAGRIKKMWEEDTQAYRKRVSKIRLY